MLREPIERSVSQYFYNSVHPDCYQYRFIAGRSIEEFFYTDGPHLADISNYQTRIFSNTMYDPAQPPDLELALKNIQSYEFVGISEQFQDSIDLLAHSLSWNVLETRRENSRTFPPSSLDQSLFERLKELNQLDAVLYSEAQAIFQKRYDAMARTVTRSFFIAQRNGAFGDIETSVPVPVSSSHLSALDGRLDSALQRTTPAVLIARDVEVLKQTLRALKDESEAAKNDWTEMLLHASDIGVQDAYGRLAQYFLTRFVKLRRARERKVILASGLFDAAWYRRKYEGMMPLQMDSLDHYLVYGAGLGYDPSPKFCTRYYVEANNDAAHSGMNPLYHFVLSGHKEGRSPTPKSRVDLHRSDPVVECQEDF